MFYNEKSNLKYKTKFNCQECELNNQLKDMWGCKKKSVLQRPVLIEIENGIEYNYWNCPVNFIGDNIKEFLNLYHKIQLFKQCKLPDFDKLSVRFVNAVMYYEQKITQYKMENING